MGGDFNASRHMKLKEKEAEEFGLYYYCHAMQMVQFARLRIYESAGLSCSSRALGASLV